MECKDFQPHSGVFTCTAIYNLDKQEACTHTHININIHSTWACLYWYYFYMCTQGSLCLQWGRDNTDCRTVHTFASLKMWQNKGTVWKPLMFNPGLAVSTAITCLISAPFLGWWMKSQRMLTDPWNLWSSFHCMKDTVSRWGTPDQSCCNHLVLSAIDNKQISVEWWNKQSFWDSNSKFSTWSIFLIRWILIGVCGTYHSGFKGGFNLSVLQGLPVNGLEEGVQTDISHNS